MSNFNELSTSLKSAKDRFSLIQKKYEQYVGVSATYLKSIDTLEKTEKTLKDNEDIYVKAVNVLELVQMATTDKVKKGFENIITFALGYILGEGFSFEIEFKRKGNYQEAYFNIKTPELPILADAEETEAGGVLDIVSLVLRVAVLELHRPFIQGTLVLDESFKHLSRGCLPYAASFLNALYEKIGRQIIMVSHKDEFVKTAGNSIQIGTKGERV